MIALSKPGLALALLTLAGCSQAPPPQLDNRGAATKEIRDAEEASIQAFATKNAELAAAAYSPEATLMFPNRPAIQGPAIKAALAEMLADPNFSLKLETSRVEVPKSGELGYTRGTYTLTMSDPRSKRMVTEKGKYLTAYAKQADGKWKIVDDISNPDGPAVGSAPAPRPALTAKGKAAKKGKQKRKGN